MEGSNIMISFNQRYSIVNNKFMKKLLTVSTLTTIVSPVTLAMDLPPPTPHNIPDFSSVFNTDIWGEILNHLNIYGLLKIGKVNQAFSKAICNVFESEAAYKEHIEKCSPMLKLQPIEIIKIYTDLIDKHPGLVLEHLTSTFNTLHHHEPDKDEKEELSNIVKAMYHVVLSKLHMYIEATPNSTLVTKEKLNEKEEILMNWDKCLNKWSEHFWDKCHIQ